MSKATVYQLYQLKITLADVRPPVWRRLLVKDCSLAKLDAIIQTCMGWEGGHLSSFQVQGEEYGDDPCGELEMESPRKRKLSQIVQSGIQKFTFTYDFGDNWVHTVSVEKTLEAEPKTRYPRCVAGSGACPPEDCGGPWGYAHLLEVIRDPKHKEHEEMLEWLGEDFDPGQFDASEINKELAGVG
jgi:Plasmid pRiA4b ORF-3-like protein